jgi:hypothetical protein
MNLTLSRIYSSRLGTFGELSDGEKILCFTCELPLMGEGKHAIPPGTYPVSRYFSPHFKRKVFLLQDVPDHSYIEIHAGNVVSDVRGCIAVGDRIDTINNQPAVMNSEKTLDHLLATLPEDLTVTVKNP